MKSVFITATDTDAGKTFVSCALINALQNMQLDVLAMKPIAAGCEKDKNGQLVNEDALALQEAIKNKLSYSAINPIALEPAIAPHIAAQHTGNEINVDDLVQSVRDVSQSQNKNAICVVEGAGGWRVPLNHQYLISDLAKEFRWPVIVVVNMKLGCLNHALLTIDAIQSDGLELAGWVANQSQKEAMSAYQENLQTLKSMIDAPCLAEFPYFETLPENLDRFFDAKLLNNLLAEL